MITLKKKSDRRIRHGHLWVFSNEIADPPVSDIEPGSIHELADSSGAFLGMVYANPASLIAARILSRKREPIDRTFIKNRVRKAFQFREILFPEKGVYRSVFGESDGLPGLIVDRYGSHLAVQSLTAGMDRLLDHVLDALVTVYSPEGIYLRNDSPARVLEGLDSCKETALGTVPETVRIQSWGREFLVDIAEGQKTGFFLDQECNRLIMKQYVSPGSRVLDLFCYSGAWGIHALDAEASEVTAVDSSRSALNLALQNVELNGMTDRFYPVREPVLDFLKKSRELWDVVILDPPAFIKSRGGLKEGVKGYIDVNRRAMNRLHPGGILITCSCSHHLDGASFENALLAASRQSGRDVRILEMRGQGPDHPVLLCMPETRYLKLIVAHVM